MQYVDELMGLETNFDIIHRVIRLGDTDACMYLIDGFCKDELMQKILQYLMDLKAERHRWNMRIHAVSADR